MYINMYKTKSFDTRSILIYIDSYKNNVPRGRCYLPYLDESKEFSSLVQMLSIIEQDISKRESLDFIYNVCSLKSRYFMEKDERDRIGKGMGFIVNILFSRNSSWQGSLYWVEGEKNIQFKSALEFIFIMNEILSADKISGIEESLSVYAQQQKSV